MGTAIVITLYFLANLAYLSTLTLHQIQTAPDDRVATATLAAIFGNSGATLMALAIMISTFGCANGLILAGARVYYAMAHDGLFFRGIGQLNANHVPAMGLVLQGIWAAILVLLRTRLVNSTTGAVTYGNLYGVLLDYVIFAALMFYVLTIGGVFVLRRKRPDAERPYRAWGYPIVPILYIVTAIDHHADSDSVPDAGHLAGPGDRASRSSGVLGMVPAIRCEPGDVASVHRQSCL